MRWLANRLRARGDDLGALQLAGITKLQLWRAWGAEISHSEQLATKLAGEQQRRFDQTIRHRCLMEEQARAHGAEVEDLRERAVGDAQEITRLRARLTESAIVPDWDRFSDLFLTVLPKALAGLAEHGPGAVATDDQDLAWWRDQVRDAGLDPDDEGVAYVMMIGFTVVWLWARSKGIACHNVGHVAVNGRFFAAQSVLDRVKAQLRG